MSRDHRVGLDLLERLQVGRDGLVADRLPPAQARRGALPGDVHRDVPVDREDRDDLETRVAGDVGVRTVAAENDAMTEAVTQRTPHLERPRHVREKAAIAEDRDRLFRIAPVMSHHCVLRSREVARKGAGLQPSFQRRTSVISLE